MLCDEILPSNMKRLKDVFKTSPIKRKLKSTDDIEFYQESWDYIAQQVCGFILPRFNTWMDIDNLDEHILLAVQKICCSNHDNKIFTCVVDNIAELAGKVHKILYQPLILKKFFKDQEIDFKLINSDDTSLAFDISSLEGVKIQKQYFSTDIVLNIMSYLSGKELNFMSMLSKEWSTLLSNNLVWRYIHKLRTSLPQEVSSRIGNWKFFTVLNNANLLQLPHQAQLTKIVSAFKPHFSNNPCVFNQFITNIFSNTCIIDHSTSHEYSYDKLDATLFIHWPSKEATRLSFSISYDNDNEFRGCSKSNYVPPALHLSLSDENYSFGGMSLFQSSLSDASPFIGRYFATEMNGKMATCFLICLITLSFGEEWLNKIYQY
ncbi:Hypothetical protein NAEGRDRAFT_69040 [Naegleria gruberi]|uniref:F-box domain-containing protein n=1 Tax=Naegleria gruberi TaxID=5762 RepID=D2VJH5_NAEGR|nr:uncharacterized protein NAEGRDRAFT_69040 [Naegleria gruberi]EFC43040.1 Hypothetical protein NAEGRDRAFT_69040 [Naegleria gruberi]|eukprot:XP_002675784.1 Hypothetical protein NAEGRDRAFT_69040 [Naegleria gruberi strain NEG-M]